MDQNAVFTYRDKVGSTLTERLIDALEKGQISEEEGTLIAGYLQDRLGQIDNDEELTLLLTEMAEKWDIFKELFVPSGDTPQETVQQPDIAVQEQAQQAEDQAQLNKAEEALSAIQQAQPQEGATQ